MRLEIVDFFCPGHLNVHLLNKNVNVLFSYKKAVFFFFFYPYKMQPEDSYALETHSLSCEGA